MEGDDASERTISGGVVVGAQAAHCHCWAYVQGRCRMKDCKYGHPKDVRPCVYFMHVGHDSTNLI